MALRQPGRCIHSFASKHQIALFPSFFAPATLLSYPIYRPQFDPEYHGVWLANLSQFTVELKLPCYPPPIFLVSSIPYTSPKRKNSACKKSLSLLSERSGLNSGGNDCSIFYLALSGAALIRKTGIEETQFHSTFHCKFFAQSVRSNSWPKRAPFTTVFLTEFCPCRRSESTSQCRQLLPTKTVGKKIVKISGAKV